MDNVMIFEVYGCSGATDGTETLVGTFNSKTEALALVKKLEAQSAYDYIKLVRS